MCVNPTLTINTTLTVIVELKQQYETLIKFKQKPDFLRFGFGKGGQYNEWLVKVQEGAGVDFSHLEQLGYAYVGSKGEETESIKDLRQMLSETLYL